MAEGTLHRVRAHGTVLATGGYGRAYFSGLATINLGSGKPLLTNVPFTVNAADNSLWLTINSTALPIAGITAGMVSVE